ncbi:MAG: BlaI/MecI/CopY family transcriptional regulator [Sphingobacteriales bacterium]|nr:MAG: BlaI/MecI/CopY family transcriptional regulator [Sphingobacteriales bacterium]
MKRLTKAEEQIMMVLWGLGSGFLMELVEAMPKPQPHKNTVATILKILVEKEFVRIETVGRFHKYHPTVSKDVYSTRTLTSVVKDYFEGSFSSAVSLLVEKKKMSIEDLELLLKQLKNNAK